MAQWTTHLRVRRSFYVTALGGKLIRDPGDLRGVRGVPRRAVGDGLGIPVNMGQSTPEWYVLIRAPRCHFPVENPHCLGFLKPGQYGVHIGFATRRYWRFIRRARVGWSIALESL